MILAGCRAARIARPSLPLGNAQRKTDLVLNINFSNYIAALFFEMKNYFNLLLTVALLFLLKSVYAQSAKPLRAKEPLWVTINTIDYKQTSLDKEASDGYVDVSYEEQVSLEYKSTYTRGCKKLISQSGVQNGSEINVSYDPTYQELTFHTIFIIRNGEKLDRLDLSKIKIIQQEKELSNFIYNGRQNAVLIIEDVRQGDIVESSYTIKGFNPIFKNKFCTTFNTEFGVPLYSIYYKLIVPKGRKMNFSYFGDEMKPTETDYKGQQVFEWKYNNIKPLHLQDYTPSWYNPYDRIQVSEFTSWKELNDWALELFPKKISISKALLAKIKEIETTYSSDEERTKAVLRFVQDDIRYMGIEMGKSSHLPTNPSKVFDQRFGDCKEKSYLLCTMLNQMSIDAKPVLINTIDKKNISSFLPSYYDFNHATVKVRLGNVDYWFDPTISYQRGDIKNIFYPDYQVGLVISDSTTGLTTIPYRKIGSESITEYFKVDGLYDGGTLVVTTNYEGSRADDTRNQFNNGSINEIMTICQKFYAIYFEDIKADSLTYFDNDSTGVFTTKEYYTIPDFWEVNNGERKINFAGFMIASVIKKPKEKKRKMPIGLQFSSVYKEEVIVEMPSEWKVTESNVNIDNSCFSYHSKFFGKYNKVYFQSEYETHKDHVALDEVTTFFDDINKYESGEGFYLKPNSDDGKPQVSWINYKTILLVLLLAFFTVRGIQKSHSR